MCSRYMCNTPFLHNYVIHKNTTCMTCCTTGHVLHSSKKTQVIWSIMDDMEIANFTIRDGKWLKLLSQRANDKHFVGYLGMRHTQS